jgi:undecaprenyl-diphosphatase
MTKPTKPTSNSFLSTIFKERHYRLLAAFLAFWIPAIIFAKLAGEVHEKEPIAFDAPILLWIHAQSNQFLDTFFLIVTTLGNAEVILPLTLAIIGYFIYKRKKRDAVTLLFIFGGAALANFLLKSLFQRDRPTFWDSIITETSYSFPSGHAMMSAALAFGVIYVLWNTKWRNLSIVIGGLFVLLVGLSRLYFGVHYPTDILAGWIVSFLWVLVVVIVSSKSSRFIHKRGS